MKEFPQSETNKIGEKGRTPTVARVWSKDIKQSYRYRRMRDSDFVHIIEIRRSSSLRAEGCSKGFRAVEAFLLFCVGS